MTSSGFNFACAAVLVAGASFFLGAAYVEQTRPRPDRVTFTSSAEGHPGIEIVEFICDKKGAHGMACPLTNEYRRSTGRLKTSDGLWIPVSEPRYWKEHPRTAWKIGCPYKSSCNEDGSPANGQHEQAGLVEQEWKASVNEMTDGIPANAAKHVDNLR